MGRLDANVQMDVERNIEPIHLSQDYLLSLVRPAFPNCRTIDSYEILSGGALNTTCKFRVNGETFVLRLYTRDRMLCHTEKAIYKLIEGKVPTPKLIYADETNSPLAYAIFQFIPGKHPWEISPKNKDPLSFRIGSVLASIHAFTFDQAGFFGKEMAVEKPFETGSSPYFEEAFAILSQGRHARNRLGIPQAEKMLAFMQKNKEFFPRVGKNICLTHSDFKPVNLLYHIDKVFVLDWEFAHAGIGILDLAILLRHRDQFPLDLERLKEGYTDGGGTLPDEWLRCALITDFVNIAALLNAPPERPRLFIQLKNTVQATMDHWEWLLK